MKDGGREGGGSERQGIHTGMTEMDRDTRVAYVLCADELFNGARRLITRTCAPAGVKEAPEKRKLQLPNRSTRWATTCNIVATSLLRREHAQR